MHFKEQLKSFVLRKGRITSNQKNAYNILKDQYLVDETFKLESLHSERGIALDIGFGAGETTIHLAKSLPETIIVGAEVYLSGIGSVLSKANQEDLKNIKIFHGDVVTFLEERVPDDFFNLIIMFYPDPWPKRKHHKRRLYKKDFLALIHRKLKKGSIFYFKTDWEHYYQEAQKVVSKKLWKHLDHESLSIEIANFPQTSFERKALSQNRPSNSIILEKLSE